MSTVTTCLIRSQHNFHGEGSKPLAFSLRPEVKSIPQVVKYLIEGRMEGAEGVQRGYGLKVYWSSIASQKHPELCFHSLVDGLLRNYDISRRMLQDRFNPCA